ncbi:uncharacterized protein IUM83_13413 [Phytophthora cinnamomi]|uniref:uncharacterized protein n=1 Tax=Phytophthora cinnamomi TaxID=4785 RepID=UPI003559AB2F|nr:hypothetical protein IUM83_13413 [Phytophthora cinnamomi]
MAAVRPIPLEQRNPSEQLRTPVDLTWQRKYVASDDDDDSDGAVSSSSNDSDSDSEGSISSSDASSEGSISSSDASSEGSISSSDASSSDQEDGFDSSSDSESTLSASDYEEDDDIGGRYSSDEQESGRPAEVAYYHQSRTTTAKTLVDTLGDMARTDNLGYIAWLVPFTGICTMVGTELLACSTHFSCSENFPTLSYAATFRPEGYAFTGGMCLTAIFIFASVVLFFWYLRLRMAPRRQVEGDDYEERRTSKHLAAGYASLLSGVTAAVSLFGLAVMDMRTHHDAHINFTIAFFVAAWATMIAVQIARKSILHEDDTASGDGKSGLVAVLRRRSFWISLRRWRRLDFFTAYTLGHLLLNIGLASTFLFALFFLCANGVWPNPLGFTAVQEAFFGGPSRFDYTELERSE